MQAWAQNLGHASLTTTFGSYGQVAPHQQRKLVRNAGSARRSQERDLQRLVTTVSEIQPRRRGVDSLFEEVLHRQHDFEIWVSHGLCNSVGNVLSSA
jgi:hypothetical protein